MRASPLLLFAVIGAMLFPAAAATDGGGLDVKLCDASGCTGQHFLRSSAGGCDIVLNSTSSTPEQHDCIFRQGLGIMTCTFAVRPSSSPVPDCSTGF